MSQAEVDIARRMEPGTGPFDRVELLRVPVQLATDGSGETAG